MGIACDKRVAVKARVLGRIGYHKQPRLENGMGTDGDIERGLADAKPKLSLEPLTMVFDQVDDSDGGVTDMGCDAYHIVELGLGWGVENAVLPQGSKTLSFIPSWFI